MGLGKSLMVETIAERGFTHRLNLPVPTHDGGWVTSFRDHPDVILLDSRLNEVQRIDLQAQSEDYCSTEVAMSRDGALFALSARAELRIVNRRGDVIHRLPHDPWEAFTGSSCFFDAAGRLWYVRSYDDAGNDCVLTVLDPVSGTALFEQAIESDIGHFSLSPLPDYKGALIDVSCGQDGSFLYLAQLTASGLAIKEYPFDDRTFSGGFSSDGSEFATGAHQGDTIEVHSFPSGQVTAAIESETIFAADNLGGEYGDTFGYQVIFLDDNHLLADTTFGRMLLIDCRTMHLIGTVWSSGFRLHGYDARGEETDNPGQIYAHESGLTSFHPAGDSQVLTVHEEATLRLLDVSPLLSTTNVLQ